MAITPTMKGTKPIHLSHCEPIASETGYVRIPPQIGPGERALKTAPISTKSTLSHANHRQPLLGSRLSGKRSTTNTTEPSCGIQSQEVSQAAASPPGSGDP